MNQFITRDGKEISFRNDYVQIGIKRYYYKNVKSISHQGENASLVFNYSGEEIPILYQTGEKDQILECFKKFVYHQRMVEKQRSQQQTNAPQYTRRIVSEEPEQEDSGKAIKVLMYVMIIVSIILAFLVFGYFIYKKFFDYALLLLFR